MPAYVPAGRQNVYPEDAKSILSDWLAVRDGVVMGVQKDDDAAVRGSCHHRHGLGPRVGSYQDAIDVGAPMAWARAIRGMRPMLVATICLSANRFNESRDRVRQMGLFQPLSGDHLLGHTHSHRPAYPLAART